MEALLETVEADVEAATEMLFKITVEGLDQAPAKVRMVCENGSSGHFFNGEATDQADVIAFTIPANVLKEATYLTKVEVLVENRYFAPVTFNLNAKKKMKVVVEAVKPRVKAPEAKVSVEKIVLEKPAQKSVLATPVIAPSVVTAPKKTSALRERIQSKKQIELSDMADDEIQKLAERLITGKK